VRTKALIWVPLHLIVLPTGHHPLDVGIVLANHFRLMLRQQLEPVTVEPLPDGRYVLNDGRHRYVAYLMAGRRDIAAVLQEDV
jgi:hypothetical protein